jgi:hypothetical protein
MLQILLVMAVIGVAALMLWHSGHSQWDRQRAGILAGCVVIASSTRSLVTDPPESLSFRLHATLIAVVVVAIAYRATKMRSTDGA